MLLSSYQRIFVFLILFHVERSVAILPKACVSSDSLSLKECCPVPEGLTEKCGGRLRGQCVFLRPIIENVPTFVGDHDRFQWPTTFYNRTCQCHGNFDGIDCSLCRPGWSGPNCDNKTIRIRRNIFSLSTEELERYKRVLMKAKETASDYVVPRTLHEQMDNGTAESMFDEVNVYDLFTWSHYYSCRANIVRENYTVNDKANMFTDFAHQGPGFITWHRALLIAWEAALQKVSGDEYFAFPYWDWAGESNCSLCIDAYFGARVRNSNTVTEPFGNWRELCLLEHGDRELCNANMNTSNLPRITRRPGGINGAKALPSKEAVYYALSIRNFDSIPIDYNFRENRWTKSPCSFRNVFEGFADSENQTGLWTGSDVVLLHNQVHDYFNGTMSPVITSPSDPIFVLHHSNVDRIFEKWLRRYNATKDEFPSVSTPIGHNRFSYLVPFLPVRTHGEFFERSENFGYTYDDIDDHGRPLEPMEREAEEEAISRMKLCEIPCDTSKGITGIPIIIVCTTCSVLILLIVIIVICKRSKMSKYERFSSKPT